MSIRRIDWLAVLLAAGAGLHAAAVTTHREYVPYVAFFAGAAVLGVVAAVLLVARPALAGLRPLLVAGNLALLGVWVSARTVGVPIGPEAGTPHAVGVHDALAAAAALAVVVGVVLNVVTCRTVATAGRLPARLGVVGAVVALAAWGGAALADTHQHDTTPATSHHHADAHETSPHHHP